MLRWCLAAALLVACEPRGSVAPDRSAALDRPTAPVSPQWSAVVGDAHGRTPTWLAEGPQAGDALLVVLGDDRVRVEDADGRQVTSIAAPGYDSAAFDPARAIVFLGGRGRAAAIDLRERPFRVSVLAESLPHDGY